MGDLFPQEWPVPLRLVSCSIISRSNCRYRQTHDSLRWPNCFFLGIGGMIEPKIVWSVGKYGKHLPVIYKLIGGALGALGVAVTLLLLLFVYRLGPPEPKPVPRLSKPAASVAAPKSNSNQPIASSNQNVLWRRKRFCT